jgi:hypothetical protein
VVDFVFLRCWGFGPFVLVAVWDRSAFDDGQVVGVGGPGNAVAWGCRQAWNPDSDT